MRKVRLTEKDLYTIVKRVLNEQRVADPNKIGERGNDISKLQQKLMDLGFLKTTSMKPTGYFGPLTQKALKDFQKYFKIPETGQYDQYTKNILTLQQPDQLPFGFNQGQQKPQTTKKTPEVKPKTQDTKTSTKLNLNLQPKNYPTPGSDYLGKGGGFERELYGGMSQEQYFKFRDKLRNFPPAKKSKLPLHIRALMDYLAGRTEPFTAADLTKEEQEFLKTVAINNAKTGLLYKTWKSIGAGNLPTAMTTAGSEKENEKLKASGQGSLANPGLAGEFMYTLGEVDPPAIKVTPDKKSVTVRDNYDFNSVGLPKEQIMKNFTDAVSSYFGGKGTLYSIVRNAVAFKEGNGYPGYPVNITV